MSRDIDRTAVDKIIDDAKALGYRVVFETNLLDLSGEWSLLLAGWGKEYSVNFKLNPATGFLRTHRYGHVLDYSTDFYPNRKAFVRALESSRELGLQFGRTAESESEDS